MFNTKYLSKRYATERFCLNTRFYSQPAEMTSETCVLENTGPVTFCFTLGTRNRKQLYRIYPFAREHPWASNQV
jgi:hypothetical protein